MERFNQKKFLDKSRAKGLILDPQPVRFTGSQRVYDYDVKRGSIIERIVLVTFSNEKTNQELYGKENYVNVYIGSSKYGLSFKSYDELINKIKNFKK